MFDATLSIDLGASYTKVGYRRSCDPHKVGPTSEESKILLFDGSPLIPSLAIRSHDTSQPWIFGARAAQINPGSTLQVFQNWKADLFRPQNDKDSATAAIIAHRFFEWLRTRIEAEGIDVRKCQTRVAMPAFTTFDENAYLLARCMDLSGWDNPTLILKAKEPHANTLGLFARGKNALSRNRAGEVQLNYGEMFGQASAYIRAARGFTLFGTHGNLLKVMIVDIGAFTTDLALVTFDVTASGDGVGKDLPQESYSLGVINELDKPLFRRLGERHGFSWSSLQFNESENCKKDLYQSKQHSLLLNVNGQPRQILLGDSTDMAIVDQESKRFVDAIWNKMELFAGNRPPDLVFLTGGGSLISTVTGPLKAACAARSIRINDLENGDGNLGNENRRSWQHTGEGLQRLATALGGASVILQENAAQTPNPATAPRPPIPVSPAPGHLPCRCQGGNKDCCFCGGRGSIYR